MIVRDWSFFDSHLMHIVSFCHQISERRSTVGWSKWQSLCDRSQVSSSRITVQTRDFEVGTLATTQFCVSRLIQSLVFCVGRDVDGSDETINSVMESLKADGFINYFGMQRFGTSSTPTHQVGRWVNKSATKNGITTQSSLYGYSIVFRSEIITLTVSRLHSVTSREKFT